MCSEVADVVCGASDETLRERYGPLTIDAPCDRDGCGALPGQSCVGTSSPRSYHGERVIAATRLRAEFAQTSSIAGREVQIYDAIQRPMRVKYASLEPDGRIVLVGIERQDPLACACPIAPGMHHRDCPAWPGMGAGR